MTDVVTDTHSDYHTKQQRNGQEGQFFDYIYCMMDDNLANNAVPSHINLSQITFEIFT